MKKNRLLNKRLHLVLLHYPVLSRDGREIVSSVTNLDIHDLARLAMTYDLASYDIINPLEAERQFINEVLDFWNSDIGKNYNSDRSDSITKIKVFDTFENLKNFYGQSQVVSIGTSAQEIEGMNALEVGMINDEFSSEKEIFIIFGTANGIERNFLKSLDYILKPIKNEWSSYNHLSVRSAASIIIDRILCKRI